MPNFDALIAETTLILQRLIQAQTINPPGNELPAILVIKEILEREGIGEMTLLEPAPGRASLVARLRGDGSARPLLLSGHVDVVPVERQHWTHDPFGGEIFDDCIWGRGTLDMKGFLSMYLAVFLLAWREKLPLKRDLILAAVADEEAGFDYGSKYLVDHARHLIEAEYGLTEAGGLTVGFAGKRLYTIQSAEKGVCWLRMTAKGRPGHGSTPHADNAVLHLGGAIARLGRAGHLPFHPTPTFERMLAALGRGLGFPAGPLLQALKLPALAGGGLRLLPEATRDLFTAMLSNTVAPTMLSAGQKTNVIPSSAEAHLDCRLLPGQTPQDAIAEIQAITGPGLRFEVLHHSSGAEFSTQTPLYAALEQAVRLMDAQAIVAPMLLPGATDACQYQRAGITVYGFTPGVLDPDFPWARLPHGHDERLPLSVLRTGIPALWQVVSQFCA
jgi:acetylornithine deacetylase/succinyl-diaminopimelate desuccinylase-like protein